MADTAALVVHYRGVFEDVGSYWFPNRPAAEEVARSFNNRYAFIVQRPDDLLGIALSAPVDEKRPSRTLTFYGIARIVKELTGVEMLFSDRTQASRRACQILMGLKKEGATLSEEHVIDPAESVETDIETKKRGRRPAHAELGEFKPVRVGSLAARVLAEALKGGQTLGSIAEASGVDGTRVAAALRRTLRVNHGIDSHVEDDGSVTVNGVDEELVFKQPREKRASSAEPRRTKNTEVDEAAQRGEMPEKPTIESETNKYNQKWFDKLYELAQSGDWEGIASFNMRGTNTYAKAINRYRDRLLWAHEAKQNDHQHAA